MGSGTHGVKSVQFGERGVESCEEVLVGLPDERALACMVPEAKPFELTLLRETGRRVVGPAEVQAGLAEHGNF